MQKLFIDRGGYVLEQGGAEKPQLIPFPVCLAIRYGDNISAECPDFVLNIEDSWVFVRTNSPLPAGTSLLLHFYIPPEDKLLQEVSGSVSANHDIVAGYPMGMYIRLGNDARANMQDLEKYLEGKKHLIDRKV